MSDLLSSEHSVDFDVSLDTSENAETLGPSAILARRNVPELQGLVAMRTKVNNISRSLRTLGH